eukprot:jgi/Botrbrau1/13700/Bobra.250_2s0001.1
MCGGQGWMSLSSLMDCMTAGGVSEWGHCQHQRTSCGSLAGQRRRCIAWERTFGKGRTQRVIPLTGGSKLLLSNLAFLTPNRLPIDKVGLEPDVACVPEVVEDSFFAAGREEELAGEPKTRPMW